MCGNIFGGKPFKDREACHEISENTGRHGNEENKGSKRAIRLGMSQMKMRLIPLSRGVVVGSSSRRVFRRQ